MKTVGSSGKLFKSRRGERGQSLKESLKVLPFHPLVLGQL